MTAPLSILAPLVNLLKAASTVSLMTLLSRITGLAREQLVAATFGARQCHAHLIDLPAGHELAQQEGRKADADEGRDDQAETGQEETQHL